MSLIYIQIIICDLIIYQTDAHRYGRAPMGSRGHTRAHTQTHTHTCPSWSILLGHSLLAIVVGFFVVVFFPFCYLIISLYAVDFHLNAFALSRIMIVHPRSGASTCMAAPMTGLTGQLNWIHVSALPLSFTVDFFFFFSSSLTSCSNLTHTGR